MNTIQKLKDLPIYDFACFFSKGSASWTMLHYLLTEGIILLEMAGLRIDIVTLKGAAWNRNM